jgi:mono/diheme cytochrome c family protein
MASGLRFLGRFCPILLVAAGLSACEQQKMADQPKYDPQEPSLVFPDGASARPPVPGTIAHNEDLAPAPQAMPVKVDMKLLERGRQRFDIFCSPCHGRDGDASGMIVRRGFPAPPTYHQDALRKASDRHIYDVITNGYGAMYSYAARVPPADRWAIVAYVRALQLSRYAPVAELSPELRARLENGAKP